MNTSPISNRGTDSLCVYSLMAKNKGSIMVISLGIFMIIAVIGVALLQISLLSTKIAKGEEEVLQAFYNAESGLEYALYLARNDWDENELRENELSTDLYDKLVLDFPSGFDLDGQVLNANTKKIYSIGRKGEAQFSINAILKRAQIFDEPFDFLLDYLDFAIASSDYQINHLNHQIVGEISKTENLQRPDLSELIKQLAETEHKIVYGSTKLTRIPTNIDYLLVLDDGKESGDLTISGDFTDINRNGKPLIVITQGKISIDENQCINTSESPLVLLSFLTNEPAIEITANSTEINGALLAPWGTVNLDSEAQISINSTKVSDSEHFYQFDLFDYQTPRR